MQITTNVLCLAFSLAALSMSVAHAQTYVLTVSSQPYEYLQGSTSLNGNMTWDDPNFEVPLGFDFNFLGRPAVRSLFLTDDGLGGVFFDAVRFTEGISAFVAEGSDLIDRGYDFNVDMPTLGSQSDISYLTEGNPGNRITKLEYRNAGFYAELEADGISTDSINLQVWFYEVDKAIEVHYGPVSVTQPALSYEGNGGQQVGFALDFDENDDTFRRINFATGPSANPIFVPVAPTDDFPYLTGTVQEGTVYRFTQRTSGVGEAQLASIDISAAPNPTTGQFVLTLAEGAARPELVEVLGLRGEVQRSYGGDNNSYDLSDLPAGLYQVRVRTAEGVGVVRVVKL